MKKRTQTYHKKLESVVSNYLLLLYTTYIVQVVLLRVEIILKSIGLFPIVFNNC